jgi:hypothetical protein
MENAKYKLTVEIPEYQRGYMKLLVKRMNKKSNDKVILSLIEEKISSFFST